MAPISMVDMVMGVVDVGSAVLLTALEVAVLVAFWLAEGLRQWAAQGKAVRDGTDRFLLLVSAGTALSAAASYGFFRAGLLVACASQAVLAALLALVVMLGAGGIGAEWARSWRARHRRHRDRRR